MKDDLLCAIVTLAGLCVGSFLNVVIWRLPRGENLSKPRSHCPGCGRMIAWYDNLPVLSWIVLRARCRHCKTRIAVRYPIVELLTGALYALCWLHWPGRPATALLAGTFLAALVATSFIDWDHKIIPDAITKPGIFLAILLAPLLALHTVAWVPSLGIVPNAWLHALAGAAAGAVVILLIRWIGGWITRKEAMGLGDVKLLAFVGAVVGPLDALYALVAASLAGSIFGIARLLWARRRPLRFEIHIEAGGEILTFDRARIKDDRIIPPPGPGEPPPGGPGKARMVLPAAGILEDEDATVKVRGTIEREDGAWHLRVTKASEQDRERLDLFAASLRYVPFGPFLAVGGAVMLLAAGPVHWFVTEGWPAFARSLAK